MKTFTLSELEYRLMTDCGIGREWSDPNACADSLYLCPSKPWLLNTFPRMVQEFLDDMNFRYRKNASDCDDAVDMALVRAAYVSTVAMFGRRCAAETLGNRKEASYGLGGFIYRRDGERHEVLIATPYDETSDRLEAMFLECVPPVQWINLRDSEKMECIGYRF
jgi:hypothetical protein